MALIDYLTSFGLWNWIFIGIVLFALETVVPGVHFLWFGLAAIIVALLGYALEAAGLGAAFTWPWQLVAFAIIAVNTVFLVKRYARPESAESDVPQLNVRAAQYIGRVVTVEEAIRGGRGKVRVGDTVWGANGEDAPVGTEVRVTGVDGISLVVSNM